MKAPKKVDFAPKESSVEVSKEASKKKDVPKERKESGTDRKEIKRAAELAKKVLKTEDEIQDPEAVLPKIERLSLAQ